MKRIVYTVLVIALVMTVGNPASAQLVEGWGLRAGLGTDITLGIAGGVEVNYQRELGGGAVELGFTGFGGTFEEETNNGFHFYDEKTTTIVAAATVDYLFLSPESLGAPYFLVGAGVGATSVQWEERSLTDTSLGTPLPGGGSLQADDGTAGGTILSFGLGKRFSNRFDVRAEVPTFFIFDAPGEASTVVPTFTLTAGIRF